VSRFIFLDRDGTLIHDKGYTYRTEDYRLLPQALEGLQAFARQGFRFVILTNQSGIGRGFFSEDDYQTFERYLSDDLQRQGIALEASYHCPHTPADGCDCRKPGTDLFKRAQRELGAVLSESWMIGDKLSDIQAGDRAGCRGQVFIGPTRERATLGAQAPAHLSADNLLEAARLIASAESQA
jgi:D-glycero-D-manno-heptose 1,7-bisphosphate phosphatase